MKKLLLIATLCNTLFTVISQQHYKVSFELIVSDLTEKDVATRIRQNLFLDNDFLVDQHSISFNSNQIFSESEVTNWVSDIALITSFIRTSNDVRLTAVDEKNGGVNCSNAAQLCNNSTVSGNSSGAGTQELNSNNQGCLYTEHQSSWYYLNIGTAGTLHMNLTSSYDYDFAIWGPYTPANAQANCPPKSAPTRCSYSAVYRNTGLTALNPYTSWSSVEDTSEPASGDGYVRYLDVLPNQVYIMLIDNFTANNTPFTITWGGTATLNCVPVVLAVDIFDFQVENVDGHNVLTWKTQMEKEHDYFSIMHSNDGENWTKLAEQKGKGNFSSYSFAHSSYGQTNYYKLTATDLNGATRTHDDILYQENKVAAIEGYYNQVGQRVDENHNGFTIIRYMNGKIEKIIK